MRATLGAAPAAGGKHVGMGTHNRLLAIGSPAFPKAYLEIIAIDPDAPPPTRPRWFGLDDPRLLARLRERPRLLHVVARSARLDDTLAALRRRASTPGRRWPPNAPARKGCSAGASPAAPTGSCCAAARCRH